MKRIVALATVLLMMGGLAACGQGGAPAASSAPAVSAPAAASPPTPAASSSAPAPAASSTPAPSSSRPAQGVITMMAEGLEEEIPATLYQGEGWSIYVPDEGWTAADVDRDDREVSWDSLVGRDVEFGVKAYPEVSESEAFRWFTYDEDDYSFSELADGAATGHDDRDRETMYLRICAGAGATYLFLGEYPDEAAEGFGARLEAIGNSLEVQ